MYTQKDKENQALVLLTAKYLDRETVVASPISPGLHSKFGCHFCRHGLDARSIAVLAQDVVIQGVASSTFRL